MSCCFKNNRKDPYRPQRVDIILFIADRNDWRKITLLMSTCCDFFSWPKSLMQYNKIVVVLLEFPATSLSLVHAVQIFITSYFELPFSIANKIFGFLCVLKDSGSQCLVICSCMKDSILPFSKQGMMFAV